MDEKITNENMSQKFNVKTAGISNEKLLNRREYEKTINTGKLCVYINFPPVYHLLNSDEWMESYGKKAREKQSEVQVDMPRSLGFSRGAFSKNLFRNKSRTNDFAIFLIA